MDFFITEHAKERAKQRCNFNEKTLTRMARKSLENPQITSKMFKYLETLKKQNGENSIVCPYGGYIYIFQNCRLITVYYIPDEFK